jgi:hypothetical protein
VLVKYLILFYFYFGYCHSQSLFNKIINSPFTISIIQGVESDGLFKPRDLDFHTLSGRTNELWVINENSASFDPNFGGSTVTYYNAGSNEQWADYRKDSYSGHFMHTASAISFSDNGGFANTLDVQDANGNPNGYFSGCTLWDSDTTIYARIYQNGPLLGSHWDMVHQSPFSVGIAAESENVYWLFDGYHSTIVKYDFQEPHPDHEHGGEDHTDGKVYRYDEINVDRVSGLSSHMVLDKDSGYLYFCDTGNQKIVRMNTNSGDISYNLNPYGENLQGYYSMVGAEYETIIDSGLTLPTGIDIYENYLIVSDYSNGDIIFYDLDDPGINQELKRLKTYRVNDIMSIKVGPDGTLWYVGTNTNELIQIIPPFDGDLNGDNNLTLADLILILSHIVGSNLLDPEFEIIADINSDNQIDIYDLLHVIDSL